MQTRFRHLVGPVPLPPDDRQPSCASRSLVDDLFAPGGVRTVSTGRPSARSSARSRPPTTGALALPNPPEIKAPSFAASAARAGHRQPGRARRRHRSTAPATRSPRRDLLYVGRGVAGGHVRQREPQTPCALLPREPSRARPSHPTMLAGADEAQTIPIGDAAHASEARAAALRAREGRAQLPARDGHHGHPGRQRVEHHAAAAHARAAHRDLPVLRPRSPAERVVHLDGPPMRRATWSCATCRCLSPPWSIHFRRRQQPLRVRL